MRKPGGSSRATSGAAVDGLPIRGWMSGSKVLTSAVPENTPWAKPKTAPSHHPLRPIARKRA
jgi:hypothetical protein